MPGRAPRPVLQAPGRHGAHRRGRSPAHDTATDRPTAGVRPTHAPPADLPALARSLRVRSHLDYWQSNDHGDRAHDVADAFEQALTPQSADELRPLLELGIDAMTKAIIKSDDSSGIQSEALGRLFDLHASASRLGSPDPQKLARWMAKVHFHDYGFTYVDPVDYSEALGESGLAAFVREVDRRAASKPDDWAVRWARQRLAVLSRDIPAIVETVGGPLSGGQHYRALVDALLEIGADDEALAYALQGLDVQPSSTRPSRCTTWRPGLLTQRGDHDEAVRLRRRQLSTFPSAASYAALHRAAETGELLAQRTPGCPRRPARAQPARLRGDAPARGRGGPRVGRLAHHDPGRQPQGPAPPGPREVAPGRRVRRLRLPHRRDPEGRGPAEVHPGRRLPPGPAPRGRCGRSSSVGTPSTWTACWRPTSDGRSSSRC